MTHRFASVMILLVLASFATAATAASPFANIPVAATLTGTNATGQTVTATFVGTADVTGFTFVGTEVVDASLTISGMITDSTGQIVTIPPIRPSLPVTFVSYTCDLLRLQLPPFGPATFFISGVGYTGNITSPGSKVILVPDITPASSQVRGVLCRIADLLDRDGSTSAIANQLNLLIRLLA